MFNRSNPVRLAILGCGGRGIGLSKEFEKIGLGKVVSLTDRNSDSLKYASSVFPTASVVKESRDLGKNNDIDAIFIATPEATHVQLALEQKGSGKHLLVEKPMATTLEDCNRLVLGFQSESKVVKMVGLCMRYNNLIKRMHELVASGTIGEVITSYCVDNVAVAGDYYFHNKITHHNEVMGLIQQKGCHSLDAISWIIGSRAVKVHSFGGLDYYGGEEPSDKICSTCDEDCAERKEPRVKSNRAKVVAGVQEFCAYSRDVNVWDNSVVNVIYENGAKLSFIECHFAPDYSREFTFIGTKGRICARFPHNGKPELTLTFRHRAEVIREEVKMGLGSHFGGDRAMLEEFVQAINENRPALTDFAVGREASAVAACAEKSIVTGLVVDVPNVDGSKRTVHARKGRSRGISRRSLSEEIIAVPSAQI
jgi:predicted dehydrogenase